MHYAWVIVASGTLTVLACLGFGRFALGMLLPAMGQSLNLSYSQMGLISTGNFVGYLVAVVLSGRLMARFGARAVVAAGLGLVAASLLAVAAARGFSQVLVLYVVTGIGSGSANVPIMALVSHWFHRSRRGRAAGWIVIGSGFAIILSGWFIPLINARWGDVGWRVCWLALGLACAAIALLVALLLRNTPGELGLQPLGVEPDEAGGPASGHTAPAAPRHIIPLLGAIYFCFGFTYVIYATFVVASLVNDYGLSEATAGRFWMWVGAFSLFSGPVFGGLSDRIGRRAGLAVVFTFQCSAYALMAARLPLPWVYLSVFLFGVVAWSVPSIMAAAVGDYLGPARAAVAFGTVTLFFGAGQIAGPALAGVMADRSGSFAGSYALAAGVVGVGMALCRLLPARQRIGG